MGKTYNRRFRLTAMPATNRWRKIYRGKVYYVGAGHCKGKGDKEGYDIALTEWEDLKRKIDHPDGNGDVDEAWRNHVRNKAAQITGGLRAFSEGIFGIFDTETTGPKTVNQAIQDFLCKQRAKVQAGALSAGRLDNLRRSLDHFAGCVGKTRSVAAINGQILSDYHTALLGQIEGGWSPDYAKTFLIAARQFIRWAVGVDLIPNLPKNIDSSDLAITIKPKKIKTFTIDEIKVLLAAASERTKLYLLLMANCGMTQKDIADLRPDEVDWQRGRITRKRSKTAGWENVPTVSYPLWKETWRLLKKFGKRTGERALLNMDGKPLKVEEWIQTGNGKEKLRKVDNIHTAYCRLTQKLSIKHPKPLKLFRKTSPTLLAGSPHPQCANWFLGHAPRSDADKSYIDVHQPTLDKAIRWLAVQLGQ